MIKKGVLLKFKLFHSYQKSELFNYNDRRLAKKKIFLFVNFRLKEK